MYLIHTHKNRNKKDTYINMYLWVCACMCIYIYIYIYIWWIFPLISAYESLHLGFVYSGEGLCWPNQTSLINWWQKGGVSDFLEQHSSSFEFKVFPSPRVGTQLKLENLIYPTILLVTWDIYIYMMLHETKKQTYSVYNPTIYRFYIYPVKIVLNISFYEKTFCKSSITIYIYIYTHTHINLHVYTTSEYKHV